MRSPLRLAIAGIFMVELERSLLIIPSSYMTSWKRYMDETIAYVKTDTIDHDLSTLNSFHENISFTYEQEINGKNSFLDILILRNGNSFETTVHYTVYAVNPPITISIYTGNHLHQNMETRHT